MNTILATAIARAFRGGLAFKKGMRYSSLGMDWAPLQEGDHWVTVHPNGEEEKGVHVLLSGGGTVKGGMGGKFNGENISDLPEEPKVEATKAEPKEKSKTKAVSGGFVRVRSESGLEYPDELVGKEKSAYKTVTADEIRKALADAGMELDEDDPDLTDSDKLVLFHPDAFRNKLREKYGYERLGDHGLTPLEFEHFLDQKQSQRTIIAGLTIGMDDMLDNTPDKFKELSNLAKQSILSATEREEWELKNRLEEAKKAGKTEDELEQIKRDAFVKLAKDRMPYVLRPKRMISSSQFNTSLGKIKNPTDAEDLALESGIFRNTASFDLKSISAPVCREILGAYKNVCDKYPCLIGQFSGIWQGAKGEIGGIASMSMDDGTLNLSKETFRSPKSYIDSITKSSKSDGWWSTDAGGNGTKAILSHELGHALEGRIWEGAKQFCQTSLPETIARSKTFIMFAGGFGSSNSGGLSNLSTMMIDALRGDKDASKFRREVSTYSGKNSFEWFAESFAELVCEENPRPQTKKFGELLSKVIKGDISDLKW